MLVGIMPLSAWNRYIHRIPNITFIENFTPAVADVLYHNPAGDYEQLFRKSCMGSSRI